MTLLLGAVADDFTGATDLANTLVRQGMATVQLFGVPAPDLAPPDVDAVTSRRSASVKPGSRAMVSRKLTTLECMTPTPLGRPVEPEV